MVLEHLFPESWHKQKIGLAFFLGVIYSIIGILLARLLFGANSGLASVIFVSILLIPSLKKLFLREEKLEEKEKKFTLNHLYKDNKHLILTYLGMFLGVFFTYYMISFLGVKFGWNIMSIFKEQVFLDPAISGRATYDFATFFSILANNWWVLLACFLLSLISGSGATFFVVWNASAWGVIFGIRAITAGWFLGQSPLGVGLVMLLIVFPHLILEGLAYIIAGIAGAVMSDDIISDAHDLKKFVGLLFLSIVSFWFLNWLFKAFISGYLLVIIQVLLALGMLWFFKDVFPDKKHKEVFIYNYWLFIAALIIFILGALVETGVLTWSGLLNNYYIASMSYFF